MGLPSKVTVKQQHLNAVLSTVRTTEITLIIKGRLLFRSMLVIKLIVILNLFWNHSTHFLTNLITNCDKILFSTSLRLVYHVYIQRKAPVHKIK